MEVYIEHFGYLAVLVGTFLEGETVLVLAGFAAHRGYLNLTIVITAAFVGTVCGDQLFYYLGRKHSQTVLNRRPGWQAKVGRVRQLLNRHEILIIFSFRFLYGLRTVAPFALGIARTSPRIFVPLNILGALAWSIAFGCAGYYFGHALELFLGHLKQLELWVMAAIVIIGVIAWLVYFKRSRQDKP